MIKKLSCLCTNTNQKNKLNFMIYCFVVSGEKKESGSKLYKPVSKLLEKKGVTVETPSLKKEEKQEKPVCGKGRGLDS